MKTEWSKNVPRSLDLLPLGDAEAELSDISRAIGTGPDKIYGSSPKQTEILGAWTPVSRKKTGEIVICQWQSPIEYSLSMVNAYPIETSYVSFKMCLEQVTSVHKSPKICL